MILPLQTTLSLTFVALSTVTPSPRSGETLPLHLSTEPVEASSPASFAQSEVDRSLEYHLRVVEERLTTKRLDPLSLPGAIISSPFRTYAPYIPDLLLARRAQKF